MRRRPDPMPDVPAQPPLTDEEKALNAAISAQLVELTAIFDQRNLDTAVALAKQAAKGEGPLVEHFAELGRRFGSTLNNPPKPRGKPTLSVIRGGAA